MAKLGTTIESCAAIFTNTAALGHTTTLVLSPTLLHVSQDNSVVEVRLATERGAIV